MKKGVLLLALLLVTAALLFAGGGGEAEPTAEMEEEQPLKVAALFQTSIEEPWDGVIHQACLRAVDEYGIEYEFTESVSPPDIEKVLREYAERGFDLIVGDAFVHGEQPVRRVAADYPEIAFAFGSEFGPVDPNFSVFDNWIHEPAYLCGVIAGTITQTNIIGAVGGYPIGEVNRLINAYKQGALSVNPDVKLKVTFISGWFDPPKSKEAALAQIEAGADVMYAERFGALQGAAEAGVYAFGNMSDQHELAPDVIITSPVWDMWPTISFLIESVMNDSFAALDLKDFSMMAKGGARLAPFYGFEDEAPPELVEKVRGLEEQILNGTFRVPIIEDIPVSD